MFVREWRKGWLLCLLVAGCSGCSRSPSIEFIGSFFPAWMFCILVGLFLTGLTRSALVRCGIEEKLGPLVVVYPSLAVALSCLLWLVFYA